MRCQEWLMIGLFFHGRGKAGREKAQKAQKIKTSGSVFASLAPLCGNFMERGFRRGRIF
jgi:hypothetical protein